jgi:fatty-acid desaturase
MPEFHSNTNPPARLHHRGTETNADPHNAKRGFFFAHIGWLLVRKHPAVRSAGKKLNMSDLEQDPLVMFQHRHCVLCFLLVGVLLPTVVPHLLWGETLTTAYFMAAVRCLPVGQVVRWSGGQVVRWLGGQVVRWSGT